MVGKCHERVPSGGVAGEAGQALGWGSTLTQTEMKERNAENNFGAKFEIITFRVKNVSNRLRSAEM